MGIIKQIEEERDLTEDKEIPKNVGLKQRLKTNNKMIREIFLLIKKNKKWWLLPIFGVFSLLTLFITLAGGSSILPAIYALF